MVAGKLVNVSPQVHDLTASQVPSLARMRYCHDIVIKTCCHRHQLVIILMRPKDDFQDRAYRR